MIRLTSISIKVNAVTFKGVPVSESGDVNELEVRKTVRLDDDPGIGAIVEQLRTKGAHIIENAYVEAIELANQPGIFDEAPAD